ncbi:FtsL-like putative cell division protein [Halocola ammonii]
MSNKFKKPESEQPKKRKKNRFARSITNLLSGEFLTREEVTRHMPFVLFLTFIFILTISWGYWFENTERKIEKTRSELEELRSEYNTTKSMLETKKQQSQVAKDIASMGLKESTSPPEVIEVDESYFED